MPKAKQTFFLIVAAVAITLALIPWYSDHLSNASLKLAGKGLQVESLHTAEKAVFVNPLSVNARFVMASAEQRFGRKEAARKALVRATEIQPQNSATWMQLATYERDKWGEPEKAREHFEQAVSLNPHFKELRQIAGIPDDWEPGQQ